MTTATTQKNRTSGDSVKSGSDFTRSASTSPHTRWNVVARWGIVTLAPCLVLSVVGCNRSGDAAKQPPAASSQSSDFAHLINIGKAHLEDRNSKAAIEAFQKAVKEHPKSAVAQRDLARAYRLARDWNNALAALKQASSAEPDSIATVYLTGLVQKALGNGKEAAAALEKAVRLDSQNAVLRFQLAHAYELLGDDTKAIVQYKETARLDPLHASAQFKLMGFARRAGDTEEVRRRDREFRRLRSLSDEQTRTPEALEECAYTWPEALPADKNPVAAPIPVGFTEAKDWEQSGITAVAVYKVDAGGGVQLIAVTSDDRLIELTRRESGVIERSDIRASLPAGALFTQIEVGNFHDEVPAGTKYDPKVYALDDLMLLGDNGMRLLLATSEQAFKDVTTSTGIAYPGVARALWLDYEHDGDLDILLTRTGKMSVWQNNGDGTFVDVTADIGIDQTEIVSDILSLDIDQDVATDVIAACGSQPTIVFENQRAGRFARMPEPPGPWPAAKLLAGNDLNNNGYPDVALVAGDQAKIMFSKSTDQTSLALGGITATSIALLDFDNDGWLDLCIGGSDQADMSKGHLRLFRNIGHGRFDDVTSGVGLDGLSISQIRSLHAADVDADGDTDLIVISSDNQFHVLQNDGGNTNHQLRIILTTLKTNSTGIGTHIELRDGERWITRDVLGHPIEIGAGSLKKVDSLQTVWTNGVIDNQVQLTLPTKPLVVTEKNVAAGSCPFLYAWDGQQFRFVTDLLGNSPIGLPLSRDVMLDADIDEIVSIGDADAFPPVGGEFRLVVTDEFREVLYLDDAELMVVDHPTGLEVHPTDKLMPPPFPESQVWATGNRRPLLGSISTDGQDRTPALMEIDGHFADAGVELPPPYRGMCEPLSITLDFGALDDVHAPILALTGWLQYGDASTNIALSQNKSLTINPPTLEAETSDGQWRPVDITVGMPAGKTKTILCDLTGKLPAGARRLRLTTTFELRWDRIALFDRTDIPDADVHRLHPTGADLQWRGFSDIRQRQPGHPTTPDFNMVSEIPPWNAALEGWCTRYGDVLELVTSHDDELVLVNSGDSLTLSFSANELPLLQPGYKRRFFFYSVGWDKDGDYNVLGGDRVGLLPSSRARRPNTSSVAADLGDEDWRIRFNTRWVASDQFRTKRGQ